MLNPSLRAFFAAIIALGSLLMFAALHLTAAVCALLGSAAPALLGTANTEYVATALAGLVSGVVATAFGIPSATKPPKGQSALATLSRLTGAAQLGTQGIARATAIVYVNVYVLVAAAAIAAFMTESPTLLSYTRNLAMVAFGTFLAIASSALAPKKEDPS